MSLFLLADSTTNKSSSPQPNVPIPKRTQSDIFVHKSLLKAGANVNFQGLENDTPFPDAVINAHNKVSSILM